MGEYKLNEVHVRLRLKEGSALYSTVPLCNPSDAVNVMIEALKEIDREMVCVVNLNNKLKPINYNVVSVGGINQSVFPVQNVFKSAILSNAAQIMLFHNHPSGDTTPSITDVNVTKKIVEAGNIMDISVIDHIIVGGITGAQYSFRENNPDIFQIAQQ